MKAYQAERWTKMLFRKSKFSGIYLSFKEKAFKMQIDMQKAKISRLILSAIAALSLIASIYLLKQNRVLQTKLSGFETGKTTATNNNSTNYSNTSISPKPSDTSMTSTENLTATLIGTFSIVYGDPQNGGNPRYRYSVTDIQGKTTQLNFTGETKFIGGTNPTDYNRERVKIVGNAKNPNLIEVSTIELE